MRPTAGSADDVEWIRAGTAPGLTIGSAIPPGFARHATVVIPDDEPPSRHDRALVEHLRRSSTGSRWWLGYLETGGTPIPFDELPRVRLYSGWSYVVVLAGPEEALTLREDRWDRTLPELMFPEDRGWLVSTLWDVDWRCVGGPVDLVDRLLADVDLETRAVDRTEDATPPGHVAL